VAGGEDGLGAHVGQVPNQGPAQLRLVDDHGDEFPGLAAIAGHQVIGQGPAQAPVVDGGVAPRPLEGQVPRPAPGREAEAPHHLVHRVLGHGPVGGELAPGHGHHAAGRAGDLVAPGQLLGDPALGGAQQGPQPGPAALHGVGRHRPAHGGVETVEEVPGVSGRAERRVEIPVVVGVGGAHVGVLAPRNGEHRPLAARHREHDGHVVSDQVAGHHHVHALGRADGVGRLAGVEGVDLLHPDAGGVDHRPGADLDQARTGVDPHRVDLAPVVLAQGHHRGVVGHRGAESQGSGAGGGQGQAGVVHPGVVVEVGPGDVLHAQGGHVGLDLGRAQAAVAAADAPPPEQVVGPQAQADEEAQVAGYHPAPVLDGDHEAQQPHQVRGVGQEPPALAQRLEHQGHIALLEVAEAAVDHLGRA